MKHSVAHRLIGCAVFLTAFLVFLSTMAPSVSFWDCGEYIATTHILGIPHPPGNPFYIVLGRFFSILLSVTEIPVAQRINSISVISAAFSALFIYLIIGRILRATWGTPEKRADRAIFYISGVVGAFFGVFNYTFWFSAVEASVYIPSILTVLIGVYTALVWAQSTESNRDRYLLLFSYIAFLGIGIHMMALFALIPVMAYVMLIDRDMRQDWRLWCIALILGSVAYDVSSFIIIAPFLLLTTGLYTYLPLMAARVVNVLVAVSLVMYKLVTAHGAGELNVGGLIGLAPFLLFAGMTVYAFFTTEGIEASLRRWRFVFSLVVFSLLGFSIHAFIPIRSAMEPVINENHPTIELGNRNRSQHAYEAFKTLLSEENQAGPAYEAFQETLQEHEEAYDLWRELRRSLTGDYLSPHAAYEAFQRALEETDLVTYRRAFMDALAENDEQAHAFEMYQNALEEEAPREEVQALHEAFTNSLRAGEADLRQSYVQYIRTVRSHDTVGALYRNFVRARTTREGSRVYEELQEVLRETPILQNAYNELQDALEQQGFQSYYTDLVSAIENNAPHGDSLLAKFERTLAESRGPVAEQYGEFVETVEDDEELARLRMRYMDAVRRNRVGKDAYEEFLEALEEHPDAAASYEAFRAALEQDTQRRAAYEDFEQALGYASVFDLHWDDFRGFLERQQYGTESMITRMFHRRGDVTTQFGFDGHMGYLGFHLTQFFHFGDHIYQDRMATAEDEHFRPGARMRNTVLGDHGAFSFFAFLVYLIPTLIMLWGIYFWYGQNKPATIMLTVLLVTTTIAFGLYMNFADGTRPDSRRDVEVYEQQVEQWQERLDEFQEIRVMALNNPQVNVDEVDRVISQLEDNKPEARLVHREVRIRDYFYTAGFMSFGMWIGLAVAGILFTLFYSPVPQVKELVAPFAAALFLVAPLLPLTQNYELNDRSHDWIPYDYAYNLLNSCSENAILFTGGDNDTFPLWFIQEAAGVRRDVRVVNFSLLNTKWYIRQLRDLEPRVPITLSDYEIDQLSPSRNEYGIDLEPQQQPRPQFLENANISITPPTYDQKPFLSVSNKMLLKIVDENAWEKPLYFAFGTQGSDLMGLEPYMETHGMVRRLRRSRGNQMDMERTKYLMDSVYQFRGISGDESVVLSETAEKTVRHYVFMYFRYINELTGLRQIQQNRQMIRQAEQLLPMRRERLAQFEAEGSPEQAEFVHSLRQQISQIEGEKVRAQDELDRLLQGFDEHVEEALYYADRAIELLPKFPMSYITKAEIYRAAEDVEAAIATLRTGIDACRIPENADLYHMLLGILEEMGDMERVRLLQQEMEEMLPAEYLTRQ
ncbi:protein O-mannosyl-transferase family [Chitinivibrio alkaliphilus]|uniref:DUF2723 domain-containing protein n=1 Tax=Chitinivibrio alkaliphilus ACht1 TaxID=1313304 RepID=U7D9I0_9BACT|nr:DUF2723 domain-containing protein [Chitinivibrio alkaliphilus]ERP38682.1 hypothetical protein CALK_0698 [Chitinivibrio alkaliphilus ACht1]